MTPSKFQILLIDDTESDAELFAAALKEAAPRVKLYWVATLEEGVQYLGQQDRFRGVGPVSLIVCDLNLQGRTAVSFIRDLKSSPHTASIPVVVYSGSNDPADANRCYEAGANSFIVKPMTFGVIVDQLKALVHYWLEIVRLPEARNPD